MATKHQTPTRPVKPSTVQKPPPVTRKPVSQLTPRTVPPKTQRSPQPPAKPAPIPNNPPVIKISDETKPPQETTEKPTPIPKTETTEKPYLDYMNDYVVDWKEPINLEPIRSPRFQSVGRLSPKLRPLGTPPGLASYQNRYNSRYTTNALPTLTPTRYTASFGLDTLGLESTDYRFDDNIESYGQKPLSLTHFKLNNDFYRQPQPYGTESRYNLAPMSTNSGVSTYQLPPNRLASIPAPNTRYQEFERLDTFLAPGLRHEPTNLAFVPHEAFTNHYVEDFIGHCIEDQFIPDILHEAINELGYEAKIKKRSAEVHRHVVDPSHFDIDKDIDEHQREKTHLYSDDWVRHFGLQARPRIPTPVPNYDTSRSLLRRIDFKEGPPMRLNTPVKFRDLMPDKQTHILTDINQELIDFELEDLLRDLGRNTLSERTQRVPVVTETRRDIYYDPGPIIVRDPIHDTSRRSGDQGQYKTIEKYAGNNLMDAICLDSLIVRYINQTGSNVDYDERQARLLDGTMLDNLINQYHNRDEFS